MYAKPQQLSLPLSPQLLLRPHRPSDAEALHRTVHRNLDHFGRFVPWLYSLRSVAAAEEIIGIWDRQIQRGSEYVFGIFEDDIHIGCIGIHEIRRANNSATLGYWLSEQHQGRGIMTRAAAALCDFSFQRLALNRLAIHCSVENQQSRAIPERLGFRLEGILQDGDMRGQEYFDLAVYGMVKRNWLSAANAIYRDAPPGSR